MIKKTGAVMAIGLLSAGIFLSGCNLVAQQADVVMENPVTTITGRITVSGETITISVINNPAKNNGGPEVMPGKVTEITSRKIDLKQYNGKQVTVTGEFSGTTLFVDEVK